MIGRKQDPKGLREVVFVPLAYDHEGDVWTSLIGRDGGFHHPLDAGLTCVEKLKRWYESIAAQSRLLRVLSEHPEFVFSGDAIDADMVRDAARKLFIQIAQAQDDVMRLLDEPIEGDRIQIGNVLYIVDDETCMLEPEDGLDDVVRGDAADQMFLHSVKEGLRRAYQATDLPVSAQGIEDAIAFLNRVLDDRGPANENGKNKGRGGKGGNTPDQEGSA